MGTSTTSKVLKLASFLFCLFSSGGCEFIELPNVGKVNEVHHVNGNRMFAPWPEGFEEAVLGKKQLILIRMIIDEIRDSIY